MQIPATIVVEISAGELLDKRTILTMKLKHIAEKPKRRNVLREYQSITNACLKFLTENPEELQRLEEDLLLVNQKLWHVEDEIRACERSGQFDAAFVILARSVYRLNDDRASIKRYINELVGCRIHEEKSYRA